MDYKSPCSLVLNQVVTAVFIKDHLRARTVTLKANSISSSGVEHAVFSCCNTASCCDNCIFSKMLRAQAQQPQSRILKVFTDRSLPCCSDLRSLSWAHHPLQAMQKAKNHKLLAAPCPWHKTSAGSYFCSDVWKSSLRLKHRTIRLRRSGVNCRVLTPVSVLTQLGGTDLKAVQLQTSAGSTKSKWEHRNPFQQHGLRTAFKEHFKNSFSRGSAFPHPYSCDTP